MTTIATGNNEAQARQGLRFDFAFDPKFRAPLALIGVHPGSAWVVVDGDEVDVHFGVLRVRTRRTNVAHVHRTGPYRWWRAIGPRLSLADHGATLGTSTAGGVCIAFHSPVSVLPGVRSPGLTLTVADPAALERAFRDVV